MGSRAATAALFFSLAALGAGSTACTHYEALRLAPRGPGPTLVAELKPGDRVEVLDRGQRRRRFVVKAVDPQGIEGSGGERIEMDQVEAVSVRRLGPALPGASRGGPDGLLGALLGAAVAVLIAIAVL